MTVSRKVVLCRPLGGFNDVLCQIEKCWSYAERFGRELVVDFGVNPFMEHVFRLLEPLSPSISVTFHPSQSVLKKLNGLEAYPSGVSGRLHRYEAVAKKGRPRAESYDQETGQKISFDFSRDYSEPLLVHHSGGGGTASFRGIRRFTLSDKARIAIQEFLPNLPESYFSAHVRATDYQTNYKDFFRRLYRQARGHQILLCSDNAEVLRYAQQIFPEERLFTFAPAEVPEGEPIHRVVNKHGIETSKRAATQLLAELWAVAHSERFFYTSVVPRKARLRQLFSGLSVLYAHLVTHRKSIPMLATSVHDLAPGKATYLASFWEKFGHRVFEKTTALRRLVRRITP